MTLPTSLLAGVELGGTKCVCVLGTEPDDIRARVVVPTAEPGDTLGRIETVLAAWHGQHGPVAALGIGSFGPLDLRPDSASYGHIVATVLPTLCPRTKIAG